jgi:hypothetical protein
MTVEALERAIESLPPHDLARFRQWFAQFDADAWDDEIEADAKSGRLESFAAEALAEFEAGGAGEL